MGLAGAGVLGGVGKGMADLGNTILQAAVADQRLQREDRKIAQNDEQLKINRLLADGQLFRRIAGQDVFGSGWEAILTHLNQAQPAMNAIQPQPPAPLNPALTQENRMLPQDVTTAGPRALALSKRF